MCIPTATEMQGADVSGHALMRRLGVPSLRALKITPLSCSSSEDISLRLRPFVLLKNSMDGHQW